MTFLTVLVTMCHLVAGNINACVTEVVTDNTMDENLTMTACMVGLPSIVKWKEEHPVYRNWTLAKWGCRIGNRAQPPMAGRA